VTLPFFTIGHSNRHIDDFIGLLRQVQIELLVDIRKMPMSRANPQFNADRLPESLAAFQISYDYIAALGGLRRRNRALPREVNGFWTNTSFHNYADYALTAEFHEGLERLISEGQGKRSAIMCSEAVWWRCHRRIVSDYLIARGETVFHIMGEGRVERAQLTTGAFIEPDATVVYPAMHRGEARPEGS
jgi:uncharacterized protein (DUF488 family)